MNTQLERNQETQEAHSGSASNSTQLLVVVGEYLFEFSSFNDWVNEAQRIWRFHGVRGDNTIVVDSKGRLLQKGKEFMRARDDGSFPVKVYRALVDN